MCKADSLSSDIKDLKSAVSDLSEIAIEPIPGFEVIEGVSIRDWGNEITYFTDGNIYLKLLDIWNKSLIPVIKVRYSDCNRSSFIYLKCSKQRWNPMWERRSEPVKEVFMTESFINTSFYEMKFIILKGTNELIFLSGEFYGIEDATNGSIDDCSYCDDSSDSYSDS